MADYKITLSADNRISDVLKQVQSDVSKLSSDASRLDAFQEKFNQVTNSTKPLKSQLRQIQQMIAQMPHKQVMRQVAMKRFRQKIIFCYFRYHHGWLPAFRSYLLASRSSKNLLTSSCMLRVTAIRPDLVYCNTHPKAFNA